MSRCEGVLFLGGIRTIALLDSGVGCTVINEAIFDKICKTKHRIPLVCETTNLQNVSGKAINTLGKAQVYLSQINKEIEVIVLPNGEIQHEMVLGADLLKQGKAIINLAEKQMVWFGKNFILREERQKGQIYDQNS